MPVGSTRSFRVVIVRTYSSDDAGNARSFDGQVNSVAVTVAAAGDGLAEHMRRNGAGLSLGGLSENRAHQQSQLVALLKGTQALWSSA